MWTRAVWREGERDEEGVVPDIWVDEQNHTLHWPKTANAEKAASERWSPKKNWWSFQLIKVKTVTGMLNALSLVEPHIICACQDQI